MFTTIIIISILGLCYWLGKRHQEDDPFKQIGQIPQRKNPSPKKATCKWQRVAEADKGKLLAFDCRTCGIRAYGIGGRLPNCKRQFFK